MATSALWFTTMPAPSTQTARPTVALSNRALSCAEGLHGDADVVARLGRDVLLELSTNTTDVASARVDGRTEVDGDASALDAVFGHLDTFRSMFPIVEP